MAKKKAKKSKAVPIAAGFAALAAIGLLSPSEEEPITEDITPPAIVEEAENQEKASVENLIEDVQNPEETIKEEPAQEQDEQPIVEIDPEQAFREKLNQYNYVGSIESDKYHSPKCRWTDKINDSNLVHFNTEDEATAAGYIPCGTCKP